MKKITIHASCVSVNNKAILLMGESGSGKSDLALRLIDDGAQLIADDYTEISLIDNILTASPPIKIEGMIEVRGIGILTLPFVRDIPLKLAVKLVPHKEVERLPEPQFFDCLGVQIPLLLLCAYNASAPVKIRFFVNSIE